MIPNLINLLKLLTNAVPPQYVRPHHNLMAEAKKEKLNKFHFIEQIVMLLKFYHYIRSHGDEKLQVGKEVDFVKVSS